MFLAAASVSPVLTNEVLSGGATTVHVAPLSTIPETVAGSLTARSGARYAVPAGDITETGVEDSTAPATARRRSLKAAPPVSTNNAGIVVSFTQRQGWEECSFSCCIRE